MNQKYVTYFKKSENLQMNNKKLFYLLSAKTTNCNTKFENVQELSCNYEHNYKNFELIVFI